MSAYEKNGINTSSGIKHHGSVYQSEVLKVRIDQGGNPILPNRRVASPLNYFAVE